MHVYPMPTRYLVIFWLTSFLTASQPQSPDESKEIALGQDDARCRLDFVDRLVRLLTAPEGSETDELFMSILKLMSKNRGQTDIHGGIGSRTYIEKRLKPEFNPTGWRRKRDLRDQMALRRVLLSVYDSLASREAVSVPLTSWQKRNSQNRVMGVIPMPKRKPLEFNPTGW